MKWVKKYWWVVGLLIALGLALLSPLASPHPDGLERVAEDQGFIDRAQDPPFQVIADYAFPGIENEAVATVMAGLVGTLSVFSLGYGLAMLLRRRREEPTAGQ
ncbi:MAG: PDGLE domain-containing protein [Anaerolineae bacterium]